MKSSHLSEKNPPIEFVESVNAPPMESTIPVNPLLAEFPKSESPSDADFHKSEAPPLISSILLLTSSTKPDHFSEIALPISSACPFKVFPSSCAGSLTFSTFSDIAPPICPTIFPMVNSIWHPTHPMPLDL